MIQVDPAWAGLAIVCIIAVTICCIMIDSWRWSLTSIMGGIALMWIIAKLFRPDLSLQYHEAFLWNWAVFLGMIIERVLKKLETFDEETSDPGTPGGHKPDPRSVEEARNQRSEELGEHQQYYKGSTRRRVI